MAIDTPLKRLSAVFVGSPWRAKLPLPDSSIEQADRQTIWTQYSGILAAGEVVEVEAPPAVGGGGRGSSRAGGSRRRRKAERHAPLAPRIENPPTLTSAEAVARKRKRKAKADLVAAEKAAEVARVEAVRLEAAQIAGRAEDELRAARARRAADKAEADLLAAEAAVRQADEDLCMTILLMAA